MNLRFFNDVFTSITSHWLEEGKPIPVEQASLEIKRDILPGFLQLMIK
jgi:hypothetical protein